MGYCKDENKKYRVQYRSDEKTWNNLIKLQDYYRLRTREDIIDKLVNEAFEVLKNEKKIE